MLLNLQNRAEQDLEYIRAAMARVEGVSSVSGLGGMLMGAVGLGAGLFAAVQTVAGVSSGDDHLRGQLLCWLAAAVIAVCCGAAASIFKARKTADHLHWDPLRRFYLCLLPNLIAAAVVSWVLWGSAAVSVLPALWLLFYGCGVLAAGTYAVPPVRVMGGCFMLCGILALFLPQWANAWLTFAFGGLHLTFGWWIFQRHGG